MINIQCTHCGKKFVVDDNLAGKQARCAACKGTFQIPQFAAGVKEGPDLSAVESPPPSAFPPAVPPPPSEPRGEGIAHTSVPEKFRQYLHHTERVYYASNPSSGVLILKMVFAGVVGLAIGLPIFFVGEIITVPLLLLIAYLDWKHRYYIVTDNRTIVSRGIFNVAVRLVMNRNIQMISINTGFIDRLLGLNTIEVLTAAGGSSIFSAFSGMAGGGVKLAWVREPRRVLTSYGM